MSDDAENRETAAAPFDARAVRRANWRWAAVGLVVALLMPVFLYFAPGIMGFEQPVVTALRQCPLAVNLLGSPIERALGLSYGSSGSEDENGRVQWSFPVRGAIGAGRADLFAVERRHVWTLLSLRLTVGDRPIDALRCAAVVTPAMVHAAHWSATVASVTGHAGVAVGDACAVELSPGRDPFVCRVQVRCGATTLYGAGTSGWVRECGPDGNGAFAVRDPLASDVDRDPTLDLRAGDGAATITDTTRGAWRVTLSFAPGR